MERVVGKDGHLEWADRELAKRGRLQAEKPDEPEDKRPNYWTRVEDITPELFGEVVGVYLDVYHDGQTGEAVPTFADYAQQLKQKGYADWTTKRYQLFEARTRPGNGGQVWVRFTASREGTIAYNPKRNDAFRERVDALLLQRKLATPLADTF